MYVLAAIYLVQPSFSKIVDFVRTADLVVTYVSHFDEIYVNEIKFPKTSNEASQLNKRNKLNQFAIVDSKHRAGLLSFLKGIPKKSGNSFACFEPHHFVYAKAGKKELRIAICFTCDQVETSGAYDFASNVNMKLRSTADKVFPIKFDPKKIEHPKPGTGVSLLKD